MPTIQWSDAAKVALERRILTKNPDTGEPIETAEEMLERVAENIAGDELDDKQHHKQAFYDLMASQKFLPNSPTLVNAGRPLQQLAACFVLPVGDSIDEIFEAVKISAKIHQTGGGTGFNFSSLRPSGSRVRSTGNVASGPVSFMRVFDTATGAIKQGGVRRGANMGVLNIEHPDIREFIHLKNDNTSLSNFNVSVAVSDQFMEHLKHDTPFPLSWKGEVTEHVSPYQLWKEISESAWISGDPGVLFMDRINKHNTVPNLGRIEATNPCGEVPLLPYHTCNLGSINLAKFVKNDGNDIDWNDLARTVVIATRFLDNIINQNKYPTEKINHNTKQARKIGLGVMGWADMLVALRIPYDSDYARMLGTKVMGTIADVADETSRELGQEKGRFPAWQNSVYGDNPKDTFRNATRTVIAPTGTLSILANCSSGIEPMFELSFTKNVMDTQVGHSSDGALALMNSDHYNKANILKTAHELSPSAHVLMQAAFQKVTDDSISKTINFPNSATASNIMDAYMLAWENDCKGITVFRDGCKGGQQVLVHGIMESTKKAVCPDCDGQMIHSEGCEECVNCGLSMCAA